MGCGGSSRHKKVTFAEQDDDSDYSMYSSEEDTFDRNQSNRTPRGHSSRTREKSRDSTMSLGQKIQLKAGHHGNTSKDVGHEQENLAELPPDKQSLWKRHSRLIKLAGKSVRVFNTNRTANPGLKNKQEAKVQTLVEKPAMSTELWGMTQADIEHDQDSITQTSSVMSPSGIIVNPPVDLSGHSPPRRWEYDQRLERLARPSHRQGRKTTKVLRLGLAGRSPSPVSWVSDGTTIQQRRGYQMVQLHTTTTPYSSGDGRQDYPSVTSRSENDVSYVDLKTQNGVGLTKSYTIPNMQNASRDSNYTDFRDADLPHPHKFHGYNNYADDQDTNHSENDLENDSHRIHFPKQRLDKQSRSVKDDIDRTLEGSSPVSNSIGLHKPVSLSPGRQTVVTNTYQSLTHGMPSTRHRGVDTNTVSSVIAPLSPTHR